MSGDTEPAIALLTKLLNLSERTPDRTRPAAISPDYDELRTAEAVERFKAQMMAAERSGAVSLRSGKHERGHLIERVTVRDASGLARHLGRSPASTVASEARRTLEPVIAGAHPWLSGLLDDMTSRWARGEAAFRLDVGEIDDAREFLALLVAVSRDQARGLDGRTFSLKATGDSKAFDRHSTRLLTVLTAHFGDGATDPKAVWSRIGLERFAHPIHLRGPVVVEDQDGVISHGRGRPFSSIHPDMLPFLKMAGRPEMLLTIENFASFNRYVREIDDGGLIIYTGGFASSGVVEMLRSLLKMVDERVPFFHWGDIDPGGVRIFRFLEESLPRRPQPYLMERSTAEARGKDAARDPTLHAIARSESAIAGLADWLAFGEHVRHLEQETLDPVSPLPARK